MFKHWGTARFGAKHLNPLVLAELVCHLAVILVMAGWSERGAGSFSLARVFDRDHEVLSSLIVKSVMLQTFLLSKRQD